MATRTLASDACSREMAALTAPMRCQGREGGKKEWGRESGEERPPQEQETHAHPGSPWLTPPLIPVIHGHCWYKITHRRHTEPSFSYCTRMLRTMWTVPRPRGLTCRTLTACAPKSCPACFDPLTALSDRRSTWPRAAEAARQSITRSLRARTGYTLSIQRGCQWASHWVRHWASCGTAL